MAAPQTSPTKWVSASLPSPFSAERSCWRRQVRAIPGVGFTAPWFRGDEDRGKAQHLLGLSLVERTRFERAKNQALDHAQSCRRHPGRAAHFPGACTSRSHRRGSAWRRVWLAKARRSVWTGSRIGTLRSVLAAVAARTPRTGASRCRSSPGAQASERPNVARDGRMCPMIHGRRVAMRSNKATASI